MRPTSRSRLLLAAVALVSLAAGALYAADAVRSTLKLKLHADGAANRPAMPCSALPPSGAAT